MSTLEVCGLLGGAVSLCLQNQESYPLLPRALRKEKRDPAEAISIETSWREGMVGFPGCPVAVSWVTGLAVTSNQAFIPGLAKEPRIFCRGA